MIALSYSALLTFALGLAPEGPRVPFPIVPTPDEVKQRIIEHLLADY